jgi:hypothetical protein
VTEVTPFRIEIPDDDLRDLRERLRRTRWPEAETVGDWSQPQFRTEMERLGYRRFGACGHDWETSVTPSIGQLAPGHVAGIHLIPPLVASDPATFDDLTATERAALDALRHAEEAESGYAEEHSTKPQTIGYGLVDSPAALCAFFRLVR